MARPTIKETRGVRELEKWLKSTETSRAALGARLGISGQAVSNWLRLAARPDAQTRELIALITKIEPDAWLTAEEKRERDARVAMARTGTEG